MVNFFDNNLSVTYINTVCHVRPGGGRKVPRNRPYHGFAYYPEGSGCKFIFDGEREYSVRDGAIIYLPKNSNYNVVSHELSDKGCYAVNFDLLQNIDCEPFVINLRTASPVGDMFRRTEKIFRSKSLGYMERSFSFLYELFYYLQKENARSYLSSDKKQKLIPAISYIGDNYLSGNINIEKLSEMCGMSSVYFRRLFGEIYGVSPIKYINGLKLSRAKELLLSEMYSVSEISSLSGFSDECYFCKLFKKETGTTPSEYTSVNLSSKKV